MTVNEMSVVETTDDSQIEETADTSAEFTEPQRTPGRVRTVLATRWKSIALLTLLIAAATLASVLYFTVYRPGQQTNPAAAQHVVDSASAGTVAVLSYAPETLDRDMEQARSAMTGEFLTYYGKFTADVVAPAVRDKGIKSTAQVVNAALTEIHPDTAKVLLFLNQQTVSRDRPQPALTASSVMVSLTKADGKWLISALDPV